MVVPPDGGWGWVIVAASFMCNLFVDGIIFSFGVFLNDISDAFAVSKARVALVGSLQSGFYLMDFYNHVHRSIRVSVGQQVRFPVGRDPRKCDKLQRFRSLVLQHFHRVPLHLLRRAR